MKLPKEIIGGSWKHLDAMGICRIGEEGKFFIIDELPPGWTVKSGKGDNNWIYLIDAKGRIRCDIYNTGLESHSNLSGLGNDSFMSVRTRFDICLIDEELVCYCHVLDSEVVLHKTEDVFHGGTVNSRRKNAAARTARKEARDWLNARFPRWKNRWAYWD